MENIIIDNEDLYWDDINDYEQIPCWDEEVISCEEWSQPEDDIQNGLTVVVKGEWIRG